MGVYLDTNFFVYLVLGTEEEREKVRSILTDIVKGKIDGYISALVLDEWLWILIKNGKRHILRESLQGIYNIRNVTILQVDAEAPLVALDYMEKYNLKPRDAMHLAVMRKHGIKEIISEDKDFDKVVGVKRIEIGKL